MTGFNPTPEQAAAIIDIAERTLARRARGVKTGATVQRNNWTAQEANINGCRVDLGGAMYRLEVATAALDAAQAEYDKAVYAVEHHTARMKELSV